MGTVSLYDTWMVHIDNRTRKESKLAGIKSIPFPLHLLLCDARPNMLSSSSVIQYRPTLKFPG